jgi:hypothetical protein
MGDLRYAVFLKTRDFILQQPVHGEFVNPRKNGAALVAERGGSLDISLPGVRGFEPPDGVCPSD